MKGKDAFERTVREALDNYEVPYNSADWAQLERRLSREERGTAWRGASAGMYALLLTCSLAVAITVHLMYADGTANTGNTTAMVPGPVVPDGTQSLVPDELEDEDTAIVEKGTVANLKPVRARTNAHEGPSAAPAATGPVPEEASAPPEKKGVTIRVAPEGCVGNVVRFAAENMPANSIHLWNFGDGNFSNKPDPDHTFSKPGKYKVTLSYPSAGSRNLASEPASGEIVIHEVPRSGFEYRPPVFHESMVPKAHFENRSAGGGNTYLWDFGDGTTSKEAHPDHIFKKKGEYHVALTVTTEKGCTDRHEMLVKADSDYNLLTPATFSPNSDGVDDTFIPEALRNLGVRFNMSVFNPKTGQQVFETSDPKRAWNGRIDNKGEACTPGEYVWVVEMSERLGGPYTGTVTLIR